MYYMSISKLWYQQDSKSKRVTFVAKLPNKWLFYFPHHLFLEEGSQVPKLFQQPCFHGSSSGICKIFCKSSALRKCTWACKSRWKDALHILRLQVQHTKTNKSCQWTKYWQKNLPKLETMDGRFPFFLVTLNKAILRCSFSLVLASEKSQPLEDPQPRNLKHPLRKIGMNSLALNSIRAHTVQSVMTYSTIQCSRCRNDPFWILLIFWGDIYHLVLHASIGPKTIQKKLYTVQSTTQLVKIDSRANIFRPQRSFLQKTVASI